MTFKPHFRFIVFALILTEVIIPAIMSGSSPDIGVDFQHKKEYVSPYNLQFISFQEDLAFDFNESPRDDWKKQAEISYDEWYSEKTLDTYGSWGPRGREYPPPENLSQKDERWMQERIILIASLYIGLPYQHHRIPDWNPPSYWPWNEVKSGERGKGIDCSDFTSFVYSYGLGIDIPDNVEKQAKDQKIPDPDGKGTIKIQNIRKESTYSKTIKNLEPGDLLYFRKSPDRKSSSITHVAIWLGDVGVSPDNTSLVIDSREILVQDCNNETIPYGVYIRPFTKDDNYYSTFDHAHRIIPTIADN